jgi:ankyrin repeat protein
MEKLLLFFAAQIALSECVKLLINNHYEVNVSNSNGGTALIFAAQKGHSECLKLIIDNRCDVNVSTTDGNTALI